MPRSRLSKLLPTFSRALSKISAPKKITLDLALQGGGAHGAFTWGVLDRLLDEADIEIQGISGTSAGAMNGAILVSGYAKGGRQGAQELLAEFWESVGEIGAVFAPLKMQQDQLSQAIGNSFNVHGFFEIMTRLWSPYQLNPFNLNPLRDLLTRLLDVEALRASKEMKLFVTATNVNTGQPRIFECHELSIDALLASACLPFLFQAVEIDGVPYWDGGYVGNPVIWPLIYNTPSSDVLLIQINPLVHTGTPSSASEIVNRLNEITFNVSLIAEMRAVDFVSRLLADKRLDKSRYRNLRMHLINMGDSVNDLDASSKGSVDVAFFRKLHDAGHAAADRWLHEHRADLGVRSSVDIRKTFLTPSEPGDRASEVVAEG